MVCKELRANAQDPLVSARCNPLGRKQAITDPYQQPYYQPPGGIQGADAHDYEERIASWASGWATDGAVETDGRLHDAESPAGWIISAWQSGSLDAVAIDWLPRRHANS